VDDGTWELLRRLDCDIAQGYYSGRPMSWDALVELLGKPLLSAAA